MSKRVLLALSISASAVAVASPGEEHDACSNGGGTSGDEKRGSRRHAADANTALAQALSFKAFK